MTAILHPTLFTKDSKGKTRFWRLEQDTVDLSRYRSVAGLLDGAPVESGWTQCSPKNIGRANATTAEQQAAAEIEAEYQKKRARKYHDSVETIGTAKIFQPMLAEPFDAKTFVFPAAAPVFCQPKLDGLRCIAKADGLWSRQGKPFFLPHIWDALAPFFEADPELILDGELYNHELKEDFNQIVSLVKRQTRTPEQEERCRDLIQYHIYDMPSARTTFFERKRKIDALALREPLVSVRTFVSDNHTALTASYHLFMEEGYEGQIIRLNAAYENKRTKSLLKRKEFQDREFALLKVEKGNGNWAGLAKRAILKLDDGRIFGAGIRGTRDQMRELLDGWRQYSAATVRFFALTPDGIPRFPVVTAFHVSMTDRD